MNSAFVDLDISKDYNTICIVMRNDSLFPGGSVTAAAYDSIAALNYQKYQVPLSIYIASLCSLRLCVVVFFVS